MREEGNCSIFSFMFIDKGRQINAENLKFLYLRINEDFTIC
jgi:hypothetical protein